MRHTAGKRVWNLDGNALRNFDRAAVVDWFANGIGNSLGDVLANHPANLIAIRLALGFWYHAASCIGAVLNALLANHAANVIGAGLASALRNHPASGVGASLLTALGNHPAGGIGASLLTALRNHPASGVGASLAARLANHTANRIGASLAHALWYHPAGGVSNGLLTALGNHSADSIWNRVADALALVSNAIDRPFFATWHPNLLANGLWRALYALGSASAGAVNAAAAICIPCPVSWITDCAAYHRASYFLDDRIPMSTVDRYGLGVIDRLGNVADNFTRPSFLYRHHDGVVNDMIVRFAYWLHHGVVDNPFTGLVHWARNGVVDNLFMRFVHGLHDGVVDDLVMGLVYGRHDSVIDDLVMSLVHWLHHGVVNDLFTGLVHWTRDIVRYLTGVRLVDGSIDRIRPRCRLGLVNWSIDRADYFAILGFSLVTNRVNLTVFVNRLMFRSCALNGLRFMDHSSHGLHYCVASWHFAAIDHTSSAILVADRAAICCAGYLPSHGSQDGYQNWYDEQPSHFPFSLESVKTRWMQHLAANCCSPTFPAVNPAVATSSAPYRCASLAFRQTFLPKSGAWLVATG